jgi:hypothetical protein
VTQRRPNAHSTLSSKRSNSHANMLGSCWHLRCVTRDWPRCPRSLPADIASLTGNRKRTGSWHNSQGNIAAAVTVSKSWRSMPREMVISGAAFIVLRDCRKSASWTSTASAGLFLPLSERQAGRGAGRRPTPSLACRRVAVRCRGLAPLCQQRSAGNPGRYGVGGQKRWRCIDLCATVEFLLGRGSCISSARRQGV